MLHGKQHPHIQFVTVLPCRHDKHLKSAKQVLTPISCVTPISLTPISH